MPVPPYCYFDFAISFIINSLRKRLEDTDLHSDCKVVGNEDAQGSGHRPQGAIAQNLGWA